MKLRAAASALLAGAVLSILAGCGLVTPVATQYPYAPSDGVQGEIGELKIINALAITEVGNPNANLIFTASFRGEDLTTLNVQYQLGARTTLTFDLGANSITNVGFGEGGALTLAGVDVAPGELIPVYFQYGDEEGVQLNVPVLDGSLEHYADLIPPAEIAPTPESTESPAA